MTDAARAAIAAQRVLIVEDDEAARLGLTELVRTWGFTVEAAADGELALAAVTSFRPTIVVSDLVMPRMDGLQLLAALADDLAHIYFLLLTAQGTVETAVDALEARRRGLPHQAGRSRSACATCSSGCPS